MSTPRTLTGSCYCGAVRFEVADAFIFAQNCHCSDCRRTTGSAFKPFGGIARTALRVTRGKNDVMRHGSDHAHDIHCRACGSLLFSVFPPREWIHVAYGSLIDSPSLHPTAHIWVSDKAPWYAITDGLPQRAEFSP
jgi:hypothetical protein